MIRRAKLTIIIRISSEDSTLLKIVGIIGSVYISSESDGASIAVCNVTVTPLLMLIAG